MGRRRTDTTQRRGLTRRLFLRAFLSAVAWLGCLQAVGCSSSPQPGRAILRNDRSRMQQATVTVKGHTFKAAIARTAEEQRIGLMNVKPEELGQDEGMLFVFPRQRHLSFWMKNTITPLDIAFINDRGRIVKIHTMKAMDMTSHPSGEPARYALEVHAGRLAGLRIREGDTVEIAETALKP